MAEETRAIEPEIVNETLTDLMKHPGAPVTLSDLAALGDRADQIIRARVQTLRTLRIESIRMTNPEDWLLFKADGDIVTGYLQDKGCDRVAPLWGIEVYDISHYEKTAGDDGEFAYSISGKGRSLITGIECDRMTGTRYSTDDYVKKESNKLKKEVYVKLAARANLDGSILRELAGMKSVPVSELEAAWQGTPKTVDRCAHGKGFGSKDVQMGGSSGVEGLKSDEIPTCQVCDERGKPGVRMVLRNGDSGQFWGCPNYKNHQDKKFTIPAAKWMEQVEAQRKAAASAQAPTQNGGEKK